MACLLLEVMVGDGTKALALTSRFAIVCVGIARSAKQANVITFLFISTRTSVYKPPSMACAKPRAVDVTLPADITSLESYSSSSVRSFALPFVKLIFSCTTNSDNFNSGAILCCIRCRP